MYEPPSAPKALLFDVQGTATDFMSTVSGAAHTISAGRHPDVDWAVIVEKWRAGYFTTLNSATKSRGSWVSVHSVYRAVLDDVLDEYGLTDFTDTEREQLTLTWQQQTPWPDVVPGLIRLKSAYTLATLSNADVCAVVRISKRAGLPWDAVFTGEMCAAFKPDPAVYRMAATYLGLHPAEIMMVACHKYDIRAAGGLGFQTAFVARPLEFGVGRPVDVTYEAEFGINASDFVDLANQLGC